MIRLGILGRGAITEIQYLPAALEEPNVRIAALVDLNANRAKALRDSHRLDCEVATDYRTVLGDVDAVINALPNHRHACVNMEALQAGVAVLCEKPLATQVTAARACCQEVSRRALPLAVSMPLRFFPSTELVDLVLQGWDARIAPRIRLGARHAL